jgi:hypothetical protein
VIRDGFTSRKKSINKNKKMSIKQFIIQMSIIIIAIFAIVMFAPSNDSLGQINVDTVRVGTNTYTTVVASSSAVEALDINTGRIGLECENAGPNAVRIYLQATSTGVTSTNGLYLAANGGSYTPEFMWTGKVFVITSSGTSSVVCQESGK